MKKRKVIFCADTSKTFNKIKNAKNNRKILSNGDVRIGDDMALCKKTSVVYKIKNNRKVVN